MSLANELRKAADRLDNPDAVMARRLRMPLRMYRAFRRLQGIQRVRTILDVGANQGEFVARSGAMFPEASIHAFEPLPVCRPQLESLVSRYPKLEVHPVALGPQPGQVEMFANDYSPSSSLLPMGERHRALWPHTAKDRKLTVAVETLDAVAERCRFEPLYLLKLDVQGYELPVLEGAVKVLPNTMALQAEVLFEPLYENQTDFLALLNFLGRHGFRFAEFLDERRLPPDYHLVYADAWFLNEKWVR